MENIAKIVANKEYNVPIEKKVAEFVKSDDIPVDKKILEGITTDLITNNFLETDEKITKYIKLITESFTDALKEYKNLKGIQSHQILFVYKGGNVLRVLAKDFMHEIPGGAAEILDEYYRKYFKKSDADFSIYIDPSLPNFGEIFDDMTNLSYLILSHLRILFIQNMAEHFDYFEKSGTVKKEILENYLVELNQSATINNLTDSEFFGGKFLSLVHDTVVAGEPITSGSDRGDTLVDFKEKESDGGDSVILRIFYSVVKKQSGGGPLLELFAIEPLNQMESTSSILLNQMIEQQKQVFDQVVKRRVSPYFISINKTLRFVLNGLPFAFNLVRMKANLVANFKDKDGGVKRLNLTGEMIDVSILDRSTTGLEDFFADLGHNVKKFEYQRADQSFKFLATTKEYLIHDLEMILFGTVRYPWLDVKYGKRMKRLLYLYMVDTLNTKKVGSILEIKKFWHRMHNQLIKSALLGVTSLNFDRFINYATDKKYYIKTFLEKYRDLFREGAQDGELMEFIKVLDENFTVILQVLDTLIEYALKDKGKIDNDELYKFSQWGGLHPM